MVLNWEEHEALWILPEQRFILLSVLDSRSNSCFSLVCGRREFELRDTRDFDRDVAAVVFLVCNTKVELLCRRAGHLKALDTVGSLTYKISI
jgi:hypothetical protein